MGTVYIPLCDYLRFSTPEQGRVALAKVHPRRAREVVKAVCERHQMPIELVMSPLKKKEVFRVRVEIIRELRALGFSCAQIGRALKRDHTSIVSALQRWGQLPPPIQPRRAAAAPIH